MVCLVLFLIACSRQQTKALATTVVATPNNVHPHYRLIDFNQLHVHLARKQAAWSLKIAENPYWQRYASDLWFEPDSVGINVPVIAFYSETRGMWLDSGYQIIGEPCGYVTFMAADLPTLQPPAPGGGTACEYKDPLSQTVDGSDPPNPGPTPPSLPAVIRTLERISSGGS